MNSETFNVLYDSHGHLTAADLTPDEKQRLYLLMQQLGASQSMTYDRFFKEGFAEWELLGIDRILTDLFNELGVSRPADGFTFDSLPQGTGIKEAIYLRMQNLGMSRNTTRKRFTTDNWRPWERRGIRNIVAEFCHREAQQP